MFEHHLPPAKADMLRKKDAVQGRIFMRTATMMTREEIRTEFGWTEDMIHSLLPIPDSPHAWRNKHTGGYTSGLYHRDRVLAVAQSTAGRQKTME